MKRLIIAGCGKTPGAISNPPVPPEASSLFGHEATAPLPHRSHVPGTGAFRRNIRVRSGRRGFFRSLLCAIALTTFAGCASQTSSSVATVDLARIQANWPKFINYSNQLAADTDAINRSTAAPRQKQQQLNLLRHRYVDMQNEVSGDVRTAAEQIANERHYNLVVTRQFVGYGGVDITPDVEKLLKITEKPPAKT